MLSKRQHGNTSWNMRMKYKPLHKLAKDYKYAASLHYDCINYNVCYINIFGFDKKKWLHMACFTKMRY